MKSFILTILLVQVLFSFDLKPIKLSNNTYYIEGKKEYFSKENKGDIANSAFIITKNYVILIDTGSSEAYGQSLKKAVAKITSNPIKYVINTHHHPDHFLGNSAFKNSDIYSSTFTKNDIEKNGDLYISNMVGLLGKISYSTKIKAPNKILNKEKFVLDGYELDILFLQGHTQSDIVIFDKSTKILFAADLIFNKRTLSTPHANIEEWINSLEKLKKINYSILVPGHGASFTDKKPIKENIAYLEYLENTLKNSANEGLDVYEVLNKPIPQEFKDFAMFKEEFQRSVINSYSEYEENAN